MFQSYQYVQALQIGDSVIGVIVGMMRMGVKYYYGDTKEGLNLSTKMFFQYGLWSMVASVFLWALVVYNPFVKHQVSLHESRQANFESSSRRQSDRGLEAGEQSPLLQSSNGDARTSLINSSSNITAPSMSRNSNVETDSSTETNRMDASFLTIMKKTKSDMFVLSFNFFISFLVFPSEYFMLKYKGGFGDMPLLREIGWWPIVLVFIFNVCDV